MKLDEMRALITTHPDFCDEQPEIVKFLRKNDWIWVHILTKSSIVNLTRLRNAGMGY